MKAPNEILLPAHGFTPLTYVMFACAVLVIVSFYVLLGAKMRNPFSAAIRPAFWCTVSALALTAGTLVAAVIVDPPAQNVSWNRSVLNSAVKDAQVHSFGLTATDDEGVYFNAKKQRVACDQTLRVLDDSHAAMSMTCGSVVMPIAP